MSRQPATDPLPHLSAVARAIAEETTSQAAFAALDRGLAATLGHKLITVLLHHAASGESERFYTSQPKAYPVGGRKPLNPTFWTEQVLRGRRPYLGRTAADIKAVFFDHELIASLGCQSVINLPVVDGREILGTVNVLHEQNWYDESDFVLGSVFAGLVVPAYRRLVNR